MINNNKYDFCLEDNRIFHCLYADQFDRSFLDHLYHLTNMIRKISKTKQGANFLQSLLNDKRAMLYFVQPSTRTYLSFKTACQILGMQTSDVRDTSTSSEVKGESSHDTLRTFASYFDCIIMRHNKQGTAYDACQNLNSSDRRIPVINAGSGKDQHPTQALLDIYTLRRSIEKYSSFDNKTIILAGDLLRGRTVRSLAVLLCHFENIKIIFSAPESYQIKADILEKLDQQNVQYTLSNKFHKHLPYADAIYMTRIQDEYNTTEENTPSSFPEFKLKYEDLNQLKESCTIMHPLPRRDEIDVKIDNDSRAVYWRQERNGMWTRTALLATIMKQDNLIEQYFNNL